MRKALLLFVLVGAFLTYGNAQSVRHATHVVPTGKGWGVEAPTGISPAEAKPNPAVVTGNGINYHGGPVMPGTVHIYFIWYGN
jgi:hypothetical protein